MVKVFFFNGVKKVSLRGGKKKKEKKRKRQQETKGNSTRTENNYGRYRTIT